jgi:hypothetical protein
MARSVPTPRSRGAPLDTHQAKSFYKRRIAMYSRVTCLQSLGFFVLVNLLTLLLNPGATLGELLTNTTNHWHLAAAFASFGAWQLVARVPFGMRALPSLDTLSSIVPMVLYAVMAYTARYPGLRAEFIVLLVCMLFQLARAVMVPSTPRFTAIIGSGMSLPAIATAWALAADVPHLPGAPVQLMVASYIGLWCAASIVTATLTSQVIYGLRKEVREAQRLGQYTLGEKIGEGGMGSVYKAHHALLRRPTAVKLLPPAALGPRSHRHALPGERPRATATERARSPR